MVSEDHVARDVSYVLTLTKVAIAVIAVVVILMAIFLT